MKKTILIFLLALPTVIAAQEKFPVFEVCKEQTGADLQSCFYTKVRNDFFAQFQPPKIIKEDDIWIAVPVLGKSGSISELKR